MKNKIAMIETMGDLDKSKKQSNFAKILELYYKLLRGKIFNMP